VNTNELFGWDSTEEGFKFWNEINRGNFQPYYDKYEPTNKPKEFTYKNFEEGDYVIVTEFQGDTDWSNHWFKPNEVLKLGGEWWKASLEKQFAAITSKGMHNGMLQGFQENYKLRHATPTEIAISDWEIKDLELTDLKVGDSVSFKMKNGGNKVFLGEVVEHSNKIGLITNYDVLDGAIITNSSKFKYGWDGIKSYSKNSLGIAELNVKGSIPPKDRWIDIMNIPIGTNISFIDSRGQTIKGKLISMGGETRIALNKSFKGAYASISKDFKYELPLTFNNIIINSLKDFKMIETPKKGSFKDIKGSGETLKPKEENFIKSSNITDTKYHQEILLDKHLKAIIVKPKSTVSLSIIGVLERLDADMKHREAVEVRIKKSEKTEVKSKVINIYKR
jgi:hypothetical protein